MSSGKKMIKNVVVCVLLGMAVATLFSLYVLVVYTVKGSEPFERAGASVALVVASYYLCAMIAGALVGVLLPLARNPLAAAVVGFLAAVPALAGVGLFAYPPAQWVAEVPSMSLEIGAILGPAVGLGVWYRRKEFSIGDL